MTKTKYFHTPSYVLSRLAFAGVHLAAAQWLNLVLNDPLSLGGPTLDARPQDLLPRGQCTPIIEDNVKSNLLFFGVWWFTHSFFAREKVKRALGLFQHPLERPLYAVQAVIFWLLHLRTWKPITNCEGTSWSPLALSTGVLTAWLLVMAAAFATVLGLFYLLPDHVFGTAKYQYPQGQFPKGSILRTFPYSLVRHPAAASFLWLYWTLPAYTPSHIMLAAMWTVFIVVGTLVFEEGGLRDHEDTKTGFGAEYAKYAHQVPAFFPTYTSLALTFCPAHNPKRAVKAA